MTQRSLSRLLFAIFLVALIMGPGPGIYLINPDPENAEARRFVMGVPIVYAWAVFWLGVQAICVAIAYHRLWREKPNLNSGEEGK